MLTDELAELVGDHPDLEIRQAPSSGVLNWRHRSVSPSDIQRNLPPEVFVSATAIETEPWLRSVAANPLADPKVVVSAVLAAAGR